MLSKECLNSKRDDWYCTHLSNSRGPYVCTSDDSSYNVPEFKQRRSISYTSKAIEGCSLHICSCWTPIKTCFLMPQQGRLFYNNQSLYIYNGGRNLFSTLRTIARTLSFSSSVAPLIAIVKWFVMNRSSTRTPVSLRQGWFCFSNSLLYTHAHISPNF